MRVSNLHPWHVMPDEAIRLQERLRALVLTQDGLAEVRLVAAADVRVRDDVARAAVVVVRCPELIVQEMALAEVPATFPYLPGLLAFREAPAILAACAKVSAEPDLLFLHGHGMAHPRRMGIASHVGLLLDRPTLGCARSLLCGQHGDLPQQAGAWVPLTDGGEVIGAAVRTREGTKPIYVSPGHRVDLEAAIRHVLACCRGHRLPEPCRLAHQVASTGCPP